MAWKLSDLDVEQATAAPGEKRELPVMSNAWFTPEVAASLGIDANEYRQIQTVVILATVGKPVQLRVRKVAGVESR